MFFNKKTTEDKFMEFRQKYNEFMKWTVKQAGKLMQEQDDFDEDEAYGLMVTAVKKSMDLAEAAFDAQEQQFEMISKLVTAEEEAVKERDALRRTLEHIEKKLDRK